MSGDASASFISQMVYREPYRASQPILMLDPSIEIEGVVHALLLYGLRGTDVWDDRCEIAVRDVWEILDDVNASVRLVEIDTDPDGNDSFVADGLKVTPADEVGVYRSWLNDFAEEVADLASDYRTLFEEEPELLEAARGAGVPADFRDRTAPEPPS